MARFACADNDERFHRLLSSLAIVVSSGRLLEEPHCKLAKMDAGAQQDVRLSGPLSQSFVFIISPRILALALIFHRDVFTMPEVAVQSGTENGENT